MSEQDEDSTRYKVVINHEEQYSIWFEHRDPPAGWNTVGVSGTKAECLKHIATVWTDMRPKSLRLAMDSGSPNMGPEMTDPNSPEG